MGIPKQDLLGIAMAIILYMQQDNNILEAIGLTVVK